MISLGQVYNLDSCLWFYTFINYYFLIFN